jgi:translation elongation factor EF-1beta
MKHLSKNVLKIQPEHIDCKYDMIHEKITMMQNSTNIIQSKVGIIYDKIIITPESENIDISSILEKIANIDTLSDIELQYINMMCHKDRLCILHMFNGTIRIIRRITEEL